MLTKKTFQKSKKDEDSLPQNFSKNHKLLLLSKFFFTDQRLFCKDKIIIINEIDKYYDIERERKVSLLTAKTIIVNCHKYAC